MTKDFLRTFATSLDKRKALPNGYIPVTRTERAILVATLLVAAERLKKSPRSRPSTRGAKG